MKTRPKSGFTLIELLLGITLFSILITIVYSTLWGGLRLGDRSDETHALFQESKWLIGALSLELENMVPYNFQRSYPDKTAFVGEEDHLQFILPTPEGLKVIRYYLLDPDDSRVRRVPVGLRKAGMKGAEGDETRAPRVVYLVREEQDFIDFLEDTPNDDGVEIMASSVLADSLKFRYDQFALGELDEDISTGEWEEPVFPDSIHMQFEFVSTANEEQPLKFERVFFIPLAKRATST